MPDFEPFITEDGSTTWYSHQFGAYLHSIHGAINEGNHVFIKPIERLFNQNKNLRVLEYGFGSGTNAALCAEYANKAKINVQYYGIENFPINIENLDQISIINFKEIYLSKWNESRRIGSHFNLLKVQTKFELFLMPDFFDVVFFDAFAPTIQPHLWEFPFLKQVHQNMKNHSVLLTYCAKGSFKRVLKRLNMIVENPPGPIGKREMTMAYKW